MDFIRAMDGSDVMELISALEEVSTEAETVKLCRQLAKAAAASAEDRDTIGSFEGLTLMYAAVKRNNKSGEAMRAYMLAMPALCHKSTVNRGIIRDDGALDEIVERLLQISTDLYNAPGGPGDMPDMDTRDEDAAELGDSTSAKADEDGDDTLAAHLSDEVEAVAACIALEALCKANDGNKKAAARINAEFNEEELVEKMDDVSVPLFKSKEGALDALFTILETTADPKLKVVAFRALRCLTQDDDHRQLSCVPSAVENREHCSDEQHFPRMRKILVAAMENPNNALARDVLLVMKTVSWHQNRIHALVFEDNVLPKVIKTMHAAGQDADVVRAVLVVLRQFCFSDDMKKKVVFETDCLPWCVSAVKKHTKNVRILEQAFGLFSNLCLRMPKIAQHLAENCDLLSMAHVVMHTHPNNASLLRTVVQSMRNISKVEEVLHHIMDSAVLLEDLREIVVKHKDDPAWRDAVEISKTFLRELREDDGLRSAPKWNEFY